MNVFSALSDPTRRRIIEMLASSEQLSATEISKKFKISPPAVSQHLKILREAQLVQVEKKAQQRIYRVNRDAMLELEDWVMKLHRLWDQGFDALDKILVVEKSELISGVERNNSMADEEKRELTFTRIFDAPRQLVFKAFSDPEQLRQWWGPQGWSMPVCMIDFRPGGDWSYCIRNPSGEKHWVRARYHKIVPTQEIAFSDVMVDSQGKVIGGLPEKHETVTFEDLGSQTRVTMHVRLDSLVDYEKLLAMGFLRGFNETLSNLEHFLQSRREYTQLRL